MRAFLSRYWWVFLVRGIVAILFGILAFALPGITLASLVLVIGAYMLVDGALALWAAVTGQTAIENRWLVGLQGVLGVAVGVLTFLMPGITAIGLLVFIVAWALAVGVLQIVAAIVLRKEIEGEFWLGLSGVLSLLFAILVMVNPEQGAIAVVWAIGAYAIVVGALLIAFSLGIRKQADAGTSDVSRGAARDRR
jgi:uncharacterized membrane protein HdeD (DUF308 family)